MILTFPNIIFCFFFYRYPESPKFLWSIGKSKECLDILRRIYEINTKQDKDSYPVNIYFFSRFNKILFVNLVVIADLFGLRFNKKKVLNLFLFRLYIFFIIMTMETFSNYLLSNR